MPSLREGITKTFRRLSRRTPSSSDPAIDDTLLATDPRQGKQYGSYRILRRLGAGGMGHVYLALDTRLGRHAALKFLSFELTADSSLFARLEQEARTASSLNHPNILTIYDIGQAHGEHYIASEFVDGVTLRAALDRRLIEPSNAIEIAMQIASALISAHAAGVVHRDLKPGNIMLRPDGIAKITDFGIARALDASGHTRHGEMLGTPDYISPEQALGKPATGASDLYALGVVAHEMLSGRRPFDKGTPVATALSHITEPPPPLPDDVPEDLAGLIWRLLAKDPADRPESARAVAVELGLADDEISGLALGFAAELEGLGEGSAAPAATVTQDPRPAPIDGGAPSSWVDLPVQQGPHAVHDRESADPDATVPGRPLG
jgi:eukaryotic-like serine/threonine-protein kinase